MTDEPQEKRLDEILQNLIDGLILAKSLLQNQPHLMDELDRLEIRLFDTSDNLMSELAVTTTTGHLNTGKSWRDFVDMRDDVCAFLVEHFK